MLRYLLLLISAFCFHRTFAQSVSWSAPEAVAPDSFGNLFPRVVLDGAGDPLVSWTGPAGLVRFARWNGSGFSLPLTLNDAGSPAFAFTWAGPELASRGDTVYLVYKEVPETDTSSHVWLHRSFNGGLNFSGPFRADHTGDSLSRFGAVAIDQDGHPVVNYMKFDAGFMDHHIVVARSQDYGASFSGGVKASGFTGGEVCDCCPPSLAAGGNRVVNLYRNNLNNLRTIWAGVSADGGASFNSGIEVDNTNWMVNACPASGPDGVIKDDTLYAVFRSSAGGTRVWWSKIDLISGQGLVTDRLTTDFPGLLSQDLPRIDVNGLSVAVAWRQVSGGTARGVVSFSGNIHQGFDGSFDTAAVANVVSVDVAVGDGAVHLVWADGNTGMVMYRKGVYSTAGVQTSGQARKIIPFPNPASGHFSLSGQLTEITLVDAAGSSQVLKGAFIHGCTIFRTDHLSKGYYFLSAVDENGIRYTGTLQVR